MALLGHRVNDGSRPIHLDESVGSTTTESQSVAGRRQDDIPQQVAQGAITPPAGSSDGQKRRAPEAIGGVRGLILRWHRRLGHPGRFAMRSFAKVAEVGITPQSVSAFFKDTQVCDTCVEAKMARLPFYSSTNRATSALDLVHADLVGPVRPTDTVTPGAPLYVLTIVDDYSRKYWAIPLVRKSDAFSQLKVDVRFDEDRLYWDELLSNMKHGVAAEPTEVAWELVAGEEPVEQAHVEVGVEVQRSVGASAADTTEQLVSPPGQEEASVPAPTITRAQPSTPVQERARTISPDPFELEHLNLDDIFASPVQDERPPHELQLIWDTPEASPNFPRQVPFAANSFVPAQPDEAAFDEDRPVEALSERALR
ncbi:unnamed protein product, partial [Tilletia controversa]